MTFPKIEFLSSFHLLFKSVRSFRVFVYPRLKKRNHLLLCVRSRAFSGRIILGNAIAYAAIQPVQPRQDISRILDPSPCQHILPCLVYSTRPLKMAWQKRASGGTIYAKAVPTNRLWRKGTRLGDYRPMIKSWIRTDNSKRIDIECSDDVSKSLIERKTWLNGRKLGEVS